jgi:hypothetical protein
MTLFEKLISHLQQSYIENSLLKLKEAKKVDDYTSKKFDFKNYISPLEKKKAEEKWGKYDKKENGKYNIDDQKKIIKAAKNGDRDAVNYIYLKCAENIGKTFWTSYLGPNTQIQSRRIRDGAKDEWAGIAFQALTGGFKEHSNAKSALETFNPDKYSYGDLFQNFKFYYWNILRNAAVEANYKEKFQGMSKVKGIKNGEYTNSDISIKEYEPNEIEANQDLNTDETFDIVADNQDVEEFLDSWMEFSQDTRLNEGKFCTPKSVLKNVIEAGANAQSVDFLKNKYPQVSRNTIMNYLHKAVEILNEYEINFQLLTKAIKKLGEDKIASYLDTGEEAEADTSAASEFDLTTVEGRRAARNARKNKSFETKWTELAKDPSLWQSMRKGWGKGPILIELLNDPSLTASDLNKMIGVKGDWSDMTYKSLFNVLKRHELNFDDIKSMPKSEREKLAAEIENSKK